MIVGGVLSVIIIIIALIVITVLRKQPKVLLYALLFALAVFVLGIILYQNIS